MIKVASIVIVCLFLTSCMNKLAVSALSVSTAKESEPIDMLSATCGNLKLTQDCSWYSGPNRKIMIGNKFLTVGADEEGKTVAVMQDKDKCGVFDLDCFTLGSNEAYKSVKDLYEKNDIVINSVTPMASGATIFGYLLKLDKDGYTILKNKTVNK